MSVEQKLLDQLKSWTIARLIPTLPESKKEERATSILLATFKVVPPFALDMLKEAGAQPIKVPSHPSTPDGPGRPPRTSPTPPARRPAG